MPIADLASGTSMNLKDCIRLAPSKFADSIIDFGTVLKNVRSQRTANGIDKATCGRISAQ